MLSMDTMVNLVLERANEQKLQSMPVRHPDMRVAKVGAKAIEDEAKRVDAQKGHDRHAVSCPIGKAASQQSKDQTAS